MTSQQVLVKLAFLSVLSITFTEFSDFQVTALVNEHHESQYNSTSSLRYKRLIHATKSIGVISGLLGPLSTLLKNPYEAVHYLPTIVVTKVGQKEKPLDDKDKEEALHHYEQNTESQIDEEGSHSDNLDGTIQDIFGYDCSQQTEAEHINCETERPTTPIPLTEGADYEADNHGIHGVYEI